MTYKPEHFTDLESAAIVRVEVRPGDAADNDESLCERVKEAVVLLGEALREEPVEKLGSELCADEGYFALEQVSQLQACGVRTALLRKRGEHLERSFCHMLDQGGLRRRRCAAAKN